MTRNITTTKNDVTGLWDVMDQDGKTLCSSCRTFHVGGIGYKSRGLARQAIRDYARVGTCTLVGGLH